MKKGKVVSAPKTKMWNTNKPGGWIKYKDMTDNNQALDLLSSSEQFKGNSEKMMNAFEKEVTNVKYHAFGKIKYRDKSFVSQNLVKLQK